MDTSLALGHSTISPALEVIAPNDAKPSAGTILTENWLRHFFPKLLSLCGQDGVIESDQRDLAKFCASVKTPIIKLQQSNLICLNMAETRQLVCLFL